MLVNLQVTFGVYRKVNHSVFANLLQHMVEESQSCADVAFARSVEVYLYPDVGLFRGAFHFGRTFSGKQQLGYFCPCYALIAKNKRFTTDVLGKLTVGFAVADNVRVCYIVLWIVDIFLNQSDVWLAGWGVVFGEVWVYQNLVEGDSFALKSLQYKIVYGPERIFGESLCSKAVLIANHHKLKVQLLAYKGQVAEHSLHEFQLPKTINLFVGWFFNQRSVAVDK